MYETSYYVNNLSLYAQLFFCCFAMKLIFFDWCLLHAHYEDRPTTSNDNYDAEGTSIINDHYLWYVKIYRAVELQEHQTIECFIIFLPRLTFMQAHQDIIRL